MSWHMRGCCHHACPSCTWLSVTAVTQPDPVVHHAGGCGAFGCYSACEGHEQSQHGATEASVLSTLQLLPALLNSMLEVHNKVQPPGALHPDCTPGPWARQAEGDVGGVCSAGH